MNADLDAGPILLRRQLPVHPCDTAATLVARKLAVAHQLYPGAIGHVLGY